MNNYMKKAKDLLTHSVSWGKHIEDDPYTGFKEFPTADFIANELEQMGYVVEKGQDIPYVKTTLDTHRPGPCICVMGEMDSILIDGPMHACGHHIGCSVMMTTAQILKQSNLDHLSGKIVFMAVPAEEHMETNYRIALKEKNIIRYPSGKPELLRRGLFDEVDLCMMVHMMPQSNEISMMTTANGNIIKEITFTGKSAHAGNAPHEGINALYAANLTLNAINALRETFTEKQYARVHPIITKGGDTVNVIPSDVTVETYIRASTLDHLKQINRSVNRAIQGCAYALNCGFTIEDVPGYFPIYTHPLFNEMATDVAKNIFSGDIPLLDHLGLCSDIGDMSSLMPIMHPFVGGVSGALHRKDFAVSDPEIAYGKSSAFLASLCDALLIDQGAKTKEILSAYKPLFTNKKEYFDAVDAMYTTQKKETSD